MMLEFYDYSTRRGVIVPLLPKIHALLTEHAMQDKSGLAEMPPHLITWQHGIRKDLLDIHRRFLFAMHGTDLAGFFFYRYDTSQSDCIYIEDLQIAWKYRQNMQVLDGLLKKLELDPGAKDAILYASSRVKIEQDKEILASVGFKPAHSGEWENIGTLAQAAGVLRIRYNRT